jgi:hypothetical protein
VEPQRYRNEKFVLVNNRLEGATRYRCGTAKVIKSALLRADPTSRYPRPDAAPTLPGRPGVRSIFRRADRGRPWHRTCRARPPAGACGLERRTAPPIVLRHGAPPSSPAPAAPRCAAAGLDCGGSSRRRGRGAFDGSFSLNPPTSHLPRVPKRLRFPQSPWRLQVPPTPAPRPVVTSLLCTSGDISTLRRHFFAACKITAL